MNQRNKNHAGNSVTTSADTPIYDIIRNSSRVAQRLSRLSLYVLYVLPNAPERTSHAGVFRNGKPAMAGKPASKLAAAWPRLALLSPARSVEASI